MPTELLYFGDSTKQRYCVSAQLELYLSIVAYVAFAHLYELQQWVSHDAEGDVEREE